MTGFKAETEHGVRSAFSEVSKIIGKAIAVGGAFELGKGVVEAAAEHQAAFAVLEKAIKNARASMVVFGTTIEKTLEKEARLKGFSDEQLASSMVRLVSATGNTKKAFTDLTLAEDLARARHIDVAMAALALSKAEQGSFTALQRFGIIVKVASTEVGTLKAEHDKAVASGATFTASMKSQYAAALATAAAHDKIAKSQAAIALVESRFGGSATTFAKTFSGQVARLKQDFHQLEVAAGSALLPGLATGAEGLGHFFAKLVEGGQVQHVFASGAKSTGDALHVLGSVAQVVGPPLLAVASAAAQVVKVLGATPILVAVGAYKTLGAVLAMAAKAQAFYTATSAAGAAVDKSNAAARARLLGITGAETIATSASTKAKQANAAASIEEAAGIRAVAISASGLLVPLEAITAENILVARSAQAAAAAETELGAAGGLRAFGRGLGGLAVGAAGGPVGLAVLGVAALAGGIAYLATRESAWSKANSETQSGIQSLTGAMNAQKDAAINLAGAQKAQRLHPTGSNAADLTAAQTASEAAAAAQAAALKKTADGMTKLGDTTSSGAAILAVWGKTVNGITPAQEKLSLATGHNISAATSFIQTLGKQSLALAGSNPLLLHNIGLLEQLTTRLKAVPSKENIELLINNQNPKAALDDLLKTTNVFADGFAAAFRKIHDAASGASYSLPKIPNIKQAIANAAAAGYEVQKSKVVAGLQKQLADITTAGDEALAIQQQDLAAQERQGRDQITQAIASAQQNLSTIGASIASSISAIIDKPLQTAQDAITLAQDKIAATFDKAGLPFAQQAQMISNAQDLIAAKYDRLSAALIPQATKLANESARAQLASDKLALGRLRSEVILPGGKALSTDPTKGLAQLKAMTKTANALTRPALEAFILQYAAAVRTVKTDQLGLKQSAIANARSAKETGLQLRGDQLRVGTDLLSTAQNRRTDPLRIRADNLRVAADQANLVKQAITQRVNDLTASFTSGKIKFATLSNELAGILVKHDTGFKRAGRLLGVAFEKEFRAQFTGLGLQVAALNAGPQRPGLGAIPQITKPEQVVKDTLLANRRAANTAHKAELEQAKKQTALLTKIHNAQKGQAFTNSLTKNPGAQSKTSKDLAGTTGGHGG